MPLLIDGYNLLHATGLFARSPGRTSLAGSRHALLEFLVAALDPAEVETTTIVFDAREAPPRLPRQTTHAGLTVHFAEKHQEADELLEELIAAATSPRRLVVVSSDHRVQRAARRRRAIAVDSDRWYTEVLRRRHAPDHSKAAHDAKRPHRPISPAEVQAWLKEFGLHSWPPEDLDASETDTSVPSPSAAPPSVPPTPPPKGKSAGGKRPQPATRSGKAPPRHDPPRPSKKVPSRPTQSTLKPPGKGKLSRRKPPLLAEGNLANPFPPGYGEDLLDESGDAAR